MGFLTKKQRIALQLQHKAERDRRICDRIKAVLAYDAGHSYSEVAQILLLDDESIRRFVQDYIEKEKLKPENGGSASNLTEKQGELLIVHLTEKTYLYAKDICVYVEKTFGVKYSARGMTRWLHANNFSYKKPHATPAKADEEKQKAFVKYYAKLKAKAGKKEPIYFADSVHPEHQTRLAYGWIPRGERKLIPTTGRQYHLNIIGAICLRQQNLEYKEVESVNGETIQKFLLQLSERHPDAKKIHLLWDNAGYHHSKEVQKFAKKHRIKIHYLPPYSPNLNPIERLWKVMHEQVTYNHYYEKFADFTEAIRGFFENIDANKKILQQRINDNFNILHQRSFAS